MTQLLAESPWMLSLLLGLLAVFCAVGWVKTGSRGAGIACVVFLLLIPVGLYIEERWVTDREQLRATIEAVADAVERGDEQAVVDAIHPSADRMALLAKTAMSRFEFDEARVTGYRHIEVRSDHIPAEAEADFMVRVAVRGGGASFETPRRVIAHFVRDGDSWRVVDFDHFPIVGQADPYSDDQFLRP